MKMQHNRITGAVVIAACLFILGGCQQKQEAADKGPAERAGEQIDKAAVRAGEELNKAGETIGKGLEKAGEKLQNASREAQNKGQ